MSWERVELTKKINQNSGIFPQSGNQSCHVLDVKKQSQVKLYEQTELLIMERRAVSCAQVCFLAQHPDAEDCRCRKVSLADSAPC